MGSATPKQFLELAGVPILVRTLRNLLQVHTWQEVVLVLPSEHINGWEKMAEEWRMEAVVVVAGGASRFHSVYNGLQALKERNGTVSIHDGVRPFIDDGLLRRLLEKAKGEQEGVVPGIPLVDSLRKVEGETNVAVSRSDYVAVQTPQTFPTDQLINAYDKGYSEQFTDDASVYEAAGRKVHVVPGSIQNIKITHPSDLALGRFFLEHEA